MNVVSAPGVRDLKGRGVLGCKPVMQTTPESPGVQSLDNSVFWRGRMTRAQDCDVPPLSFTLSPTTVASPTVNMAKNGDETSSSQLVDLIKCIRSEIGESIRVTFMQNAASGFSPVSDSDQSNSISQTYQGGATVIDASKINLVLRSDVNAPPYFRGDDSDKCSVFEWEELMRGYLKITLNRLKKG